MAEIRRATLFGKLHPVAYQTVDAATVFCKLRGNPFVELVHWVAQTVQGQGNDWVMLLPHTGVDAAALSRDITSALERLPRGATRISDLSLTIEQALEKAWVLASLGDGQGRVRSGHVLLALLQHRELRVQLFDISRQFERIALDRLSEHWHAWCEASPEAVAPASAQALGGAEPGQASGAMGGSGLSGQEALQRFTTDLTAQARGGRMDPIVGRDDEIRQVIDILMRRRQNNPILVGEAGVGKTAVVEGLAQRIVRGDVPPALREVQLRVLDVGLLQAGASMKGEFEQRLRSVIDEVQAAPQPVILFIDETHTLVGAGGQAGTGDAANLLKPALARGQLRTIGATTWAEYKKHIEKDPALTRRFQAVQVDEPDEVRALLMMRGVAATMEAHHRVLILDEALEAAVRLSHRYIPARQLPDKCVSLLDTACARVAVSLHATPPAVDDAEREIEALHTELALIEREARLGVDVAERASSARERLDAASTELLDLRQRWQAEQALVERLLALRAALREPDPGTDSPADHVADGQRQAAPAEPCAKIDEADAALRTELQAVQAELAALQGDSPLILPTVDHQVVASVVADWTGIPVGRMARDEIENVLTLAERLGERVIGQDHAMALITRRVQTSRAGLDHPDKPVGVFLLAGTSGVGKTETALALAEALYGGEQNLITLNMSEYQEAHTVSSLKGAPPGYVGYGEGGVLTEAVRRKPYSVVLLDEVEKAHPDVHELFFQVFDKGWMEDGEGRRIDFKNTLILLTTNVGTELIQHLCQNPEEVPDPEAMAQALRQPLLRHFPPALLGRLVTIPYYPLTDGILTQIVELQLGRIQQRVQQRYKVPLRIRPEVVDLVVSRCTESESGGRMIDAILTNTLLPTISRQFLERLMAGEPFTAVTVGVTEGEAGREFSYSFTA